MSEGYWKATSRVAVPGALSIALFVTAYFLVILPTIEESILARKREMIRELTGTAVDSLEQYHRAAEQGRLGEQQARSLAQDHIRGLRYGPQGKDYFWVNDMSGVMLVHPHSPELEGTNMINVRDPRGNRLVAEFVRTVERQGRGYVRYVWQWKDDPNREAPKLSYVAGFEPWGWVVGTGFYTEDVQAQISAITRRVTVVTTGVLGVIVLVVLYIAGRSVRAVRQRNRAQHELAESERKHRALVENAADGIFLAIGDKLAHVNPALADLLETDGEALRSCRPSEMAAGTPGGRRFVEELERHGDRSAPPAQFESQLVTRTGEVRDVLVSMAGVVVGDRDGVIGLVSDITAGKRAEEEKRLLEAELAQARRLEALGQLAGGIAHDFNNLLTTVLGNAELLRMDAEAAGLDTGMLDQIAEAARRGAELTQQMLAFARKGKKKAEPVDLHERIRSVVEELALPDDGVEVHMDLEAENRQVLGDSRQLEGVIRALLLNARDAMPEGGTVTLSTEEVEQAANLGGEEAEAGRYVRVTVADTGVGMDSETLERAAEPFFTTKDVGQGTGLGLASAVGVVQNHGGSLRIESQPGQGTTVRVLLPQSPKDRDEAVQRREAPGRLGSGSVLVVDDEPGVRDFAQKVLDSAGWQVETASGGSEALACCRERGDELSVVLLDMSMPRMDGLEVLRRLRELDPSLPVLVASGYAADETVQRASEYRGVGVLAKPFRPDELVQRVERLARGRMRGSTER